MHEMCGIYHEALAGGMHLGGDLMVSDGVHCCVLRIGHLLLFPEEETDAI